MRTFLNPMSNIPLDRDFIAYHNTGEEGDTSHPAHIRVTAEGLEDTQMGEFFNVTNFIGWHDLPVVCVLNDDETDISHIQTLNKYTAPLRDENRPTRAITAVEAVTVTDLLYNMASSQLLEMIDLVKNVLVQRTIFKGAYDSENTQE